MAHSPWAKARRVGKSRRRVAAEAQSHLDAHLAQQALQEHAVHHTLGESPEFTLARRERRKPRLCGGAHHD
eukprot:1702460-Alexandrium_andersonii.AAC.1